MLDDTGITEIAHRIATANLTGSAAVVHVKTAPYADSEGRDAPRITIVVGLIEGADIKGEAALDTLIQIHEQLQAAGDNRFPLIEYEAETEAVESGL